MRNRVHAAAAAGDADAVAALMCQQDAPDLVNEKDMQRLSGLRARQLRDVR